MRYKNYFLISLTVIFLIGLVALFNAGYDLDPEIDDDPSNLENEESEEVITEEKNHDETEVQKEKMENGKDDEEEGEEGEFFEPEDQKDDEFQFYSTSAEISNFKSIADLINCKYEIDHIPSPKGISFRPNSSEFWITSLMNKRYGVVVFDYDTKKRKEITLPDGGGVEVIFNKNGDYGFVSQMETGRVFKIDANSKKIVRSYETESTWTKVMALSPDEKYLFASNWSGSSVSKITIETGEVEIIPTTSTPRGIYVTDDNLYVAGFGNGVIKRHDLKTGSSEKLIETGGAMRHMVSDGNYLYVSDMGRGAVYRVKKSTDEVEKFVETDNNPNTIDLALENSILIVSNRGANHPSGDYSIPGPEWGTVLFFEVSTGKLVEAIIAGNQPTGLSFSEKNKKMAYSNFLDGNSVVCKLPSVKTMNDVNEISDEYKNKITK